MIVIQKPGSLYVKTVKDRLAALPMEELPNRAPLDTLRVATVENVVDILLPPEVRPWILVLHMGVAWA